jgi:L-aminopeptidase/D-esterase-like protein
VNRNLLTDVPASRFGNAADAKLASGVTTIVFDEPAVASADVRGGAPGTRDIDLLQPDETVERIDAVVLSGGSAFGLDAPSGVQAFLREQGRGFAIGPVVVPIVPGAIVFDLLNGGTRTGAASRPIATSAMRPQATPGSTLRWATPARASAPPPSNLKGGLGSASATTRDGAIVGAIVIVNAVGSVTVGDGPHFWAAPFEPDGEFGGRGLPPSMPPDALESASRAARARTPPSRWSRPMRRSPRRRRSASRPSRMTGSPRAIYPVHTPLDGDIVFAAVDRQERRARPDGLRRTGRARRQCAVARRCPRGLRGDRPALPRRAAGLEGKIRRVVC